MVVVVVMVVVMVFFGFVADTVAVDIVLVVGAAGKTGRCLFFLRWLSDSSLRATAVLAHSLVGVPCSVAVAVVLLLLLVVMGDKVLLGPRYMCCWRIGLPVLLP